MRNAPLFQTQRASYAMDRAANHTIVAYHGDNTADVRRARALAASRARTPAPRGLFANLICILFGL